MYKWVRVENDWNFWRPFFQRKCPFWTFYGKLDYSLFVSISVRRKYETDLPNLEPFVQFDLKNIHGGLLLLVKLQAEATSSLFWTITKCCENTLDWNFLVDLVTWIERDKGMVSIILLFFLFISYNCLLLTHSVPITTLFISVLSCIMLQVLQITGKHSLHRKWSLPLRISSFFCAVIHHYIY